MRVLIIGGGGREHALAWRLAQSRSVSQVLVSPGNPGIAQIATCLPAPAKVAEYVHLAEKHQADLTVVGPEVPLVAGVVDLFQSRGLKIIGPTQAAARLEGSKLFAKECFKRASIPTARSGARLDDFSLPVVIKADGLAAGKGVVIAHNRAEAEQALSQLGPAVVIEEYLEGEEVSFIGLSDGTNLIPFAPTQDHKRIFDGDQGPNTGGMGAYADNRILTSAQTGEIMERIMLPTLAYMRKQGTPFTGFLFAGLMMTTNGPKILEFNVRLGDPETQALLYAFEGDFAAFLQGETSAVKWNTPSVCVVLAAPGYPGPPKTGDPIEGIDKAEALGATVFHAGTKLTGNRLQTAGGRVLGVTAGGATLQQAIDRAYSAGGRIRFNGLQRRSDIGKKGLRRW